MIKAVLDTNVFISGLIFGGNPQKILKAWVNRDFTLCLSPALKAEIINKLKIKFKAPDEYLLELSLTLDKFSEKYLPKTKINICRDPADNFLLELAKIAKPNYIISGDKDVLTLKKFEDVRIISPTEFLKILE